MYYFLHVMLLQRKQTIVIYKSLKDCLYSLGLISKPGEPGLRLQPRAHGELWTNCSYLLRKHSAPKTNDPYRVITSNKHLISRETERERVKLRPAPEAEMADINIGWCKYDKNTIKYTRLHARAWTRPAVLICNSKSKRSTSLHSMPRRFVMLAYFSFLASQPRYKQMYFHKKQLRGGACN